MWGQKRRGMMPVNGWQPVRSRAVRNNRQILICMRTPVSGAVRPAAQRPASAAAACGGRLHTAVRLAAAAESAPVFVDRSNCVHFIECVTSTPADRDRAYRHATTSPTPRELPASAGPPKRLRHAAWWANRPTMPDGSARRRCPSAFSISVPSDGRADWVEEAVVSRKAATSISRNLKPIQLAAQWWAP